MRQEPSLRRRWRFATAIFLPLLLVGPVVSSDEVWEPPHQPWGDPDLQGVWTNATVTPLERPERFGDRLVLTPEMGRQMEENNPYRRMRELDARPTDPDAPAPEAGQGVGGYNAFWTDPGDSLVQIDGQYHTSIVTAPEDGQVPYSEQGRERFDVLYGFRDSEVGLDGPEARGLGERCLVGFGSTGGPPMLPVLYNNHYQIVQTPDYVMIMVEMNHDARIIRLDGEHRDPALQPWLGDSVGRWEGDTLVVETTNFNPQQEIRAAIRHRLYVPSSARVVERFTRTGPDTIHYQFTVEDEEAYTQSWSGELPLRVEEQDRIFEYACHEGNHSLPNILAGARAEEGEQ